MNNSNEDAKKYDRKVFIVIVSIVLVLIVCFVVLKSVGINGLTNSQTNSESVEVIENSQESAQENNQENTVAESTNDANINSVNIPENILEYSSQAPGPSGLNMFSFPKEESEETEFADESTENSNNSAGNGKMSKEDLREFRLVSEEYFSNPVVKEYLKELGAVMKVNVLDFVKKDPGTLLNSMTNSKEAENLTKKYAQNTNLMQLTADYARKLRAITSRTQNYSTSFGMQQASSSTYAAGDEEDENYEEEDLKLDLSAISSMPKKKDNQQ